MKAIKIVEPGKAAVTTDEPIPSLPSGTWLRIKTIAVALNPTDWKHIKGHMCPTRSTPGCDVTGIVEEVGAEVTKPFKKGDRVFATVHGSNVLNLDRGAFQEYVLVPQHATMRVPDGVAWENVAGAGVAVVTVGQGLYQEMGLPWPEHQFKKGEEKSILIWGGSSAMGSAGIQFAKLSGFTVITTCSPSNFDYVKSLGADAVFNSRDPTVGAQIREHTHNKLYYAWDCIGEHGSVTQCCDALASSAPEGQELRYGTILFGLPPAPREDVISTATLAYTANGYAFKIFVDGNEVNFPAQPEQLEFIDRWVPVAERLLAEGKWKTHRVEVREGGLEGVLKGLDDLQTGTVSGVKLVYRIGEP
ncbi:putative zinc-binding oxidoreductase ToxD [Periconia macrospinosa]|uniref:Putative zinc-binding oxidoreductase ToxD n=1 Tax=Periconia macrospinosa TaxID=97972 RepID=A0A2V1D7R0_9PLEO|nr:putative zinc-binding oxidoreductase ToxD [Periconia macrospinosa]